MNKYKESQIHINGSFWSSPSSFSSPICPRHPSNTHTQTLAFAAQGGNRVLYTEKQTKKDYLESK